MSIITLSSPWCFNAMSLEQSEVRELQKHFVNEDNHQCDWFNTDYCGITSDGLSEYFCSPEFFDEDDDNNKTTVYTIEQLRDIIAEHLAKQPVDKLEDGVVYYVKDTHYPEEFWLAVNKVAYVNIHQKYVESNGDVDWQEQLEEGDRWEFTKATPEQIAHYKACVKAGNYVEPESVTQFVVGKWYKYDEGRYFKYKSTMKQVGYNQIYYSEKIIGNKHVVSCDYIASNDFEKHTLEHPVEDLSEIQDLLPDGHEDKWVKTAPKSERYLETMKFFEQLREPERIEAIANYDEEYSIYIPKSLEQALSGGFCWDDTEQESDYWEHIHGMLLDNTYFQEELLVFGKYKIGDIVVLQVCTDRYPMFKVSKDSTPDKMVDETGAHSTNPGSFRPATPEEIEAYNQGIRNVADIKPKDCKVVPEYVECVSSKTHHYKEGKIYTWPNTISDSGKPNKIEVLKGSVWEFKPSTKEAYDKQQEKLKMEELLSEANPTEIKPAKGMHVRCLKESTWNNGKAKIGQVFEIQDVSRFGDLRIENQSLVKGRLSNGEFELLPDYKEEPWVAQVGDWVYVLENCAYGSVLNKGEIVKCIKYDTISQQFKEEGCTWLTPKYYRKATQEEIDSVIKYSESRWPVTENVAWSEWTADNWYVEVSSQEEANAVIDAAAKMYGKPYDKYFKFNDEWKYVGLCHKNKDYTLLSRKFIHVGAKPRLITDFIQPKIIRVPDEIDCINSRPLRPEECYIFAGEVTEEEFNEIKRLCKPQQDELVIYKPKQTRLVEPGAVSASVSTTNLIIKSNSKYL